MASLKNKDPDPEGPALSISLKESHAPSIFEKGSPVGPVMPVDRLWEDKKSQFAEIRRNHHFMHGFHLVWI